MSRYMPIAALAFLMSVTVASHAKPWDVTEQTICDYFGLKDAGDSCEDIGLTEWLDAPDGIGQPLSFSELVVESGNEPKPQIEALWSEGFVPPGRDMAPWPFQLPVEWDADPFDDRNWRFNLHAWRMVGPMLAAHEATGQPAFMAQAVSIMEDWHVYHYGPEGRASQYQWYDMAAGLRAMKLGYVISHVLHGTSEVSDEELKFLIDLAWRHAAFLMDPGELADNNHGLFQIHGLNLLCSVVPDLTTCQSYEDFVSSSMRRLVKGQFSDEGIHLEHSPAYHFFGFEVLHQIFDSGRYGHLSGLVERIELAGNNRKWMLHPDKSMVTVGDSRPRAVALDYPPGAPECVDAAMGDVDCMLLGAFPDSGYAVVRSDWAVPAERASMLFFVAAFHSGVHKLPDDLSFEWFEQGGRVLTNAGVYAYESDEWRDFVESPRAHNTIELDRRTFATSANAAYGSALTEASKSGSVFRLEGRVAHVNLERTILYVPGKWLGVRDRLFTEWPEWATQWFHFAPEFEVAEKEGRIIGSRDDGFQLLIGFNANQATLHRGEKEPRHQGWVTESYGEMAPRWSLALHHSGPDLEMLTWFAVSEEHWESARNALNDLSKAP